jgi:anthranilate phosphoribosyltransferase
MAHGINKKKGMDEFSPCGKTRVVELKNGKVTTYTVTPEDFGIKTIKFEKIASRDTAMGNAKLVLDVLQGKREGPEMDFFCMNAAAALYIADHVKGYREGMELARETLHQGRAYEKLQELITYQGAR